MSAKQPHDQPPRSDDFEFVQRDSGDINPTQFIGPLPPSVSSQGDDAVQIASQDACAGQDVGGEEPFWLAESDFLAQEPLLSSGTLADSRRARPGLWEAFAWMIGVFALQIIAVVVMTAFGSSTTELFTGVQVMFLLGVIVAVWWRMGRARIRLLPLTPFPWRHAVILCLVLLPLGIISRQLYVWAEQVWQSLTNVIPNLPSIEKSDPTKAVKRLVTDMPIGLVIAVIAIVPALGEELVFRGVIGRGLTARYGLFWGILVTSLLFVAIHIQPAHVFSLIPLSIMLHLSHVAARSLWAPILLHFLNNGLLVVSLFAAEQAAVANTAGQTTNAAPPPLLVLAAVPCVLAFAVLLWKSRVQFHLPDGRIWSPGYATAERPPRHLCTEARCTSAGLRTYAFAGAGLLAFLAANVAVVLEAMSAQ
ncbi:MAG: CPBP family intramembrane metalloprotease [Planctomycetes bacterium]|nr:CPBP family intramembrane metalloprotease [Planctomycetota bacterium]